jgi:hypothetical protein
MFAELLVHGFEFRRLSGQHLFHGFDIASGFLELALRFGQLVYGFLQLLHLASKGLVVFFAAAQPGLQVCRLFLSVLEGFTELIIFLMPLGTELFKLLRPAGDFGQFSGELLDLLIALAALLVEFLLAKFHLFEQLLIGLTGLLNGAVVGVNLPEEVLFLLLHLRHLEGFLLQFFLQLLQVAAGLLFGGGGPFDEAVLFLQPELQIFPIPLELPAGLLGGQIFGFKFLQRCELLAKGNFLLEYLLETGSQVCRFGFKPAYLLLSEGASAFVHLKFLLGLLKGLAKLVGFLLTAQRFFTQAGQIRAVLFELPSGILGSIGLLLEAFLKLLFFLFEQPAGLFGLVKLGREIAAERPLFLKVGLEGGLLKSGLLLNIAERLFELMNSAAGLFQFPAEVLDCLLTFLGLGLVLAEGSDGFPGLEQLLTNGSQFGGLLLLGSCEQFLLVLNGLAGLLKFLFLLLKLPAELNGLVLLFAQLVKFLLVASALSDPFLQLSGRLFQPKFHCGIFFLQAAVGFLQIIHFNYQLVALLGDSLEEFLLLDEFLLETGCLLFCGLTLPAERLFEGAGGLSNMGQFFLELMNPRLLLGRMILEHLHLFDLLVGHFLLQTSYIEPAGQFGQMFAEGLIFLLELPASLLEVFELAGLVLMATEQFFKAGFETSHRRLLFFKNGLLFAQGCIHSILLAVGLELVNLGGFFEMKELSPGLLELPAKLLNDLMRLHGVCLTSPQVFNLLGLAGLVGLKHFKLAGQLGNIGILGGTGLRQVFFLKFESGRPLLRLLELLFEQSDAIGCFDSLFRRGVGRFAHPIHCLTEAAFSAHNFFGIHPHALTQNPFWRSSDNSNGDV